MNDINLFKVKLHKSPDFLYYLQITVVEGKNKEGMSGFKFELRQPIKIPSTSEIGPSPE